MEIEARLYPIDDKSNFAWSGNAWKREMEKVGQGGQPVIRGLPWFYFKTADRRMHKVGASDSRNDKIAVLSRSLYVYSLKSRNPVQTLPSESDDSFGPTLSLDDIWPETIIFHGPWSTSCAGFVRKFPVSIMFEFAFCRTILSFWRVFNGPI